MYWRTHNIHFIFCYHIAQSFHCRPLLPSSLAILLYFMICAPSIGIFVSTDHLFSPPMVSFENICFVSNSANLAQLRWIWPKLLGFAKFDQSCRENFQDWQNLTLSEIVSRGVTWRINQVGLWTCRLKCSITQNWSFIFGFISISLPFF